MKVDFITRNSVVTDAIGNHKNRWTDYYTCYATVSGGGSSVNDETERRELQSAMKRLILQSAGVKRLRQLMQNISGFSLEMSYTISFPWITRTTRRNVSSLNVRK